MHGHACRFYKRLASAEYGDMLFCNESHFFHDTGIVVGDGCILVIFGRMLAMALLLYCMAVSFYAGWMDDIYAGDARRRRGCVTI